jgi:hypothetical protein
MRISTGSEELAENVPECYFVCHKSNITWPRVRTRVNFQG